ncbi:MAG: ArnT family glycosyltransferase, partial [Myxococcota bacterium]
MWNGSGNAPPRTWGIALLAGALALFLLGLGRTDLWAPDEPRYAHVAAELFAMERGAQDLVLLRVNGEPYDQKPPLYFWLAALASVPGGRVSEWSARLPSALAGLATLALTFALGRRLFDARVAAWGTAFLATVFDFAFLARRARLD